MFHLAVVLEILDRVPAFGAIKRRLCDIEIAAFDQLRHLSEEERQKKRADVAAVDVGVGHDDDLVVAGLFDVEILTPDAGAQRIFITRCAWRLPFTVTCRVS